jgi:hypothetical protein
MYLRPSPRVIVTASRKRGGSWFRSIADFNSCKFDLVAVRVGPEPHRWLSAAYSITLIGFFERPTSNNRFGAVEGEWAWSLQAWCFGFVRHS